MGENAATAQQDWGQAKASESVKEYEQKRAQHDREAAMTIGQRLDARISKLTGEVEKLQTMRKRLGAAADQIRAEDFMRSMYSIGMELD